jgi:sugar lactone lactonase YvrE
LLPDEKWQLLSDQLKDARGPACGPKGEVYFVDTASNRISKIDLDGHIQPFVADAAHANGLTVGADGKLYSVSSLTGKVMSYDSAGTASQAAQELPGHSIIAMPGGELYVTKNAAQSAPSGEVWLIKDGKKTLVDSGLKRATGLAYRPDRWLLSVADGYSKWAYSYQINPDGSLINKERYFWLHVADGDDDTGAESICYALEGQMFVATRSGIQVCADDGPTQVILPMPDRSPVLGVCLGGRDLDTLYAFCGNKIWKRKVKTHAMGAFTPWTKVGATKL